MPSPGTGHATLLIQGETFDLSMSLLALEGLDSIGSLVTGETRDVMCKVVKFYYGVFSPFYYEAGN